MSRADKIKAIVGIALYVGSLAYSVRTIVVLRRQAQEIDAQTALLLAEEKFGPLHGEG